MTLVVTPDLSTISLGKVPEGLRYERRGICLRCGWCCMNEACPNLAFVSGLAKCLAHPSVTGKKDQREPKCGRFPQAPPIMHEDCGYWFVDTWEDDRVVKARQV